MRSFFHRFVISKSRQGRQVKRPVAFTGVAPKMLSSFSLLLLTFLFYGMLDVHCSMAAVAVLLVLFSIRLVVCLNLDCCKQNALWNNRVGIDY